MGSTTDEFVSATDTQFGGALVAVTDRVDAVRAADNTGRLNAKLLALSARGGGTLWFGPGRYALGRAATPLTPTQYRALGSVEFGDVVVPDDVTLAFAPGASLQPLGAAHGVIPRPVGGPAREDGCVRVELLGAIEADAGQVFVVAEGGGMVLLAGTRIPEVDPHWWATLGDVQTSPAATARALQAAVDAAHRDRLRALRQIDDMGNVRVLRAGGVVLHQHRPPLPVVLRGDYRVDRPIVFGATDDELAGRVDPLRPPNTDPFVLRGVSSAQSLNIGGARIIAESAGEISAVLRVAGVPGFSIENLALDGNLLARACVRCEFADGLGVASFEGVSVRNARAAQLVVTRRPNARGRTVMSFVRGRIGTIDPPRAREGRGSLRWAHTPPTSDTIGGHALVGIDFDGGDTARLEVRASFFEGAFDPAVAARSGRITLTECVAHGERLFDPRAPDVVNRETRTTNGTEVVIEPATHRNTAGLIEAASVLLHEHDSQSWQMLHAWPATGDAACAASVVVNCNCAPSPGEPLAAGSDALLTQARTSFLATRDVPSIVWDGAPASGLRLTVLGGMVNGPGQVTAPPGQRPRGNGGGVLWVHSRSVPVVVAGLQARLGSAFGSDVMSLSLRRVLEPLASEGVPTIVASGTWRP